MIKEILEDSTINESEALKLLGEINKKIQKAKDEKDTKTLDVIDKELNKLINLKRNK